MTIEKRLENLENLVNALMKKIDNNKFYTDADISGNRQNINNNTEGVTENSDGVFDIASLADENSQAIMDLAEMVAEMEANNG